MTDEWGFSRVVHRVRHITRYNDIETQFLHLANAECPVENADIRVDAHQHDIRNAFLLAVVINLLPVVTNTVIFGDLDGRMLPFPGINSAGGRWCRTVE